MADNSSQLIFEVHKGQAQFAYFLLGGAGGAIAYALHETAGVALSDAPWPLGLAVVLWALSFALGCFGVDARHDGLLTNAIFLRVFGDLPPQPENSTGAKVINDALDTVKADLRKPATLFRWQKWVLFAGALAYIGGHVMQMAATPSVNTANMIPSSLTRVSDGRFLHSKVRSAPNLRAVQAPFPTATSDSGNEQR